jgi:hypothetical protein
MKFTTAWLVAREAERRTKKATQRLDARPARITEAEIQEAIAGYLNSFGRDCYHVWHRMDKATTCRVGTPDFVGWLRGKPFALEVKRPGGKQSREQAGELMRCQLAGGVAAVVYSLEEAIEVLRKMK